MDALPGLEWHLIGPVQSNKTRVAAERFAWVHTLEREKIARRLSEQRLAGLPPLNVLIQVRSEERRVGKECRSRCDWSSDVCSSDLRALRLGAYARAREDRAPALRAAPRRPAAAQRADPGQIGRASCRERV